LIFCLSTTTIRIEAQACPENKASIRVLEKSGFQHEGTIRKAMYVQGNHLDAKIYGILRNEWRNSQVIKL
jgi:ribosomal-protein-alanine N-acetyltransferase